MFFKHPLFWKEWKTAKWWSLLIGSMFLVMFLSVSNSLSKSSEILMDRASVIISDSFLLNESVIEPVFLRIFSNSFETLVVFILPLIIIMSIMLFQSERKESVGMFISSLPFTKKEQFRVKWFTGVLAFTIPFLLAILLVIIMRQVNSGWITQWYNVVGLDDLFLYDNVWIVLSILVQSYLFFIAFFSVLMLMQSIIANNISASIIGSIVIAAPWFILDAGGATLSRLFNNYRLRLYRIRWGNLYYFLFPNRDISIHGMELGDNIININPLISMDDYIVKIVILTIIVATTFYMGVKFYEKNDNSRNGYLLMFPWVGKILVPGVTLCSALLGNNVINKIFGVKSVFFEVFTLVISSLIGYLMIKKIIGLTEKYEA